MRILYLILLVALAGICEAQITFPKFDSHTTDYDKKYHRRVLSVVSRYNFSVTFYTWGVWGTGVHYKTLAYRRNKWHAITLEINDRKHIGRAPYNTTLKRKNAEPELCDSLIKQLIQLHLFSINPDSLNIHTKTAGLDSTEMPDGTMYMPSEETLIITDLPTVGFIIKKNRKTRFLNSYAPHTYYEWLPVPALGSFIDCADTFTKAWQATTEE